MWRRRVRLLSVIVLGLSCARHAHPDFYEAAFFTSGGIARETLLGLAADSIFRIEREKPYYRDALGYVYRVLEKTDTLEVWVEYYVSQQGRVEAMSFTYESPVFGVLTKRYQAWREYLRGRYGVAAGHVGQEVWETPDGKRIRLLLSPERRYLQVSYALGMRQ